MDPRIRQAVTHIHEHLPDPGSTQALAQRVNLSASRFAHLFRSEVGTSPRRYIHALRMLRARSLVQQTFLSMKEIMSVVGCNDASHFTRDFRRLFGASPRAWRAALRDGSTPDRAEEIGTDSASISRIAVLANERHSPPNKPIPRARAPDFALHHLTANPNTSRGRSTCP